jgi:outer membrane protein OmpA-like peptidoglycan-associated protein
MTVKLNLTLAMMAVALTGCQALATQPISTTEGARQVNQVAWTKSGTGFDLASLEALAANQSRVVIVRKQDDDSLQTSANIAIDGRLLTSLQPGHYSETIVCPGAHEITAQLTGAKTNSLPAVAQRHTLNDQSTHYFAVDVSDTTQQPTIRPLNMDEAMRLLADSAQQTHQVDRVVSKCMDKQEVVPKPMVPVAPSITPVAQTPTSNGKAIAVDMPITLDVLFDFDSSRIQATYYPRLAEMAQFMTANPDTTAVIEGHTDSKGPANYNLTLSKARANAVKTYLLQKYGIDAKRLTTTGYGESQPVASNDTEQGRQSNRRVIATIGQV